MFYVIDGLVVCLGCAVALLVIVVFLSVVFFMFDFVCSCLCFVMPWFVLGWFCSSVCRCAIFCWFSFWFVQMWFWFSQPMLGLLRIWAGRCFGCVAR